MFWFGVSAKAFDGGPNNSPLPDNWNQQTFDDTAWQQPVAASPDVLACVTAQMGSWGSFPAYWGPKDLDYYAFRQHIQAPSANSYSGSVLDVRGFAGSTYVYLNGQLLGDFGGGATHQYAIGQYLAAGDNVVAVLAQPQTSTHSTLGTLCNSESFRVAVRT